MTNRVRKEDCPMLRIWPVLSLIATALGSVSSVVAGDSRLELVQTIQLEGAAGRLDHMALDADGRRLFVANLSNDSLDVIDLSAGKPIKRFTGQRKIQGVAYAPGVDRIFVGVGEAGQCNIFDGKNYELLRSLKMPDADNVRFNPASGLVYVGRAERALTAVDAKTYEVKATLTLPGQPEAFQLDSERKRLYVNCVGPSSVAVVDLSEHKLVANYTPPGIEGLYPMTLDRNSQRIYIGCRKPAVVICLDAKSGDELWRTEIAGDIDDLFFDGKRRRLYASCGAGSLAVLEEKEGGRFE